MYDGWKGVDHIGEPIPKMLAKVQQHLANGELVKIFTARVNTDDMPGDENNQVVRNVIQSWCLKHIGMVLSITCVKDYGMIQLYDDRAIQIIPNTGVSIAEQLHDSLPFTFDDILELKKILQYQQNMEGLNKLGMMISKSISYSSNEVNLTTREAFNKLEQLSAEHKKQ